MAEPTQHVFLVPGFLGFTTLGEFPYFRHVSGVLRTHCNALGLNTQITTIRTHPTSSLRRRAARLAEAIDEVAGRDGQPIHLVAHSSGGLDARLLVTPGASLPTDLDVERLAGRIRSVVTVTTPHMGTPLASFFDGLFGQHVLRLLSAMSMYGLRFGRMPRQAAERLVTMLRTPGSKVDNREFQSMEKALLEGLAPDENTLERLIEEINVDQALVPQLTPEGLDVFNASTGDRPTVSYGSVVARSQRPGVRSALRAGIRPYAHATFAIFSALHGITGRMPAVRATKSTTEHEFGLSKAFRDPVSWADSDGIVPTRSQLWGDLIFATQADHLDVVGHFDRAAGGPSRGDWLASGSGFTHEDFDALWRSVARYLSQAAVDDTPRSLAPAPVAQVRRHTGLELPMQPRPIERRPHPTRPGVAASVMVLCLTAAFGVFAAITSFSSVTSIPGARWATFVLTAAAATASGRWMVQMMRRLGR